MGGEALQVHVTFGGNGVPPEGHVPLALAPFREPRSGAIDPVEEDGLPVVQPRDLSVRLSREDGVRVEPLTRLLVAPDVVECGAEQKLARAALGENVIWLLFPRVLLLPLVEPAHGHHAALALRQETGEDGRLGEGLRPCVEHPPKVVELAGLRPLGVSRNEPPRHRPGKDLLGSFGSLLRGEEHRSRLPWTHVIGRATRRGGTPKKPVGRHPERLARFLEASSHGRPPAHHALLLASLS
mmetsp:Transcript_7087/g.21270  ORF Transcript_7087/g.21270 Transcript_7087/m.21270 type:complete len:240 (+) Transcript_7087:331-1050(+)